jgi:cephalosporin hydroxylase
MIFPPRIQPGAFRELQEVREVAAIPGDIDEHLETIFTETLLHRPALIVELGVRGGMSTFVFERAAGLCNAWILSVDVDDCSFASSHPRWMFVRSDDVSFAGKFKEFSKQRGTPEEVDLLFIDTSHLYEHTVQEIEAWFPLLSGRAKVIFHDTNLKLIGGRRDGCFQLSWDNHRGVARAIERYLGCDLDMNRAFIRHIGPWLVRHQPHCNGLTILDRLP